jgi:DNA-binding NarL/FixJ family response regulator
MLEKNERFSVVQKICDLPGAVVGVEEEEPDVILVDLSLAAVLELEQIRMLGRQCPGGKVLVLGSGKEEADIVRCIEAGASGYLLKDSSLDDLNEAIVQVANGGAACSACLHQTLFNHLAELAEGHRGVDRAAAFELSAREFEILQLLADGLSNKQIAAHLCLSIHTVKNHVHHVLEKLAVEDRHAAVETARQQGWLGSSRMMAGRSAASARMDPVT